MGIVKKFIFPRVKLACIVKLLIDPRLTVFQQLFSQTSVGSLKCPIDKMIRSQGHLTV